MGKDKFFKTPVANTGKNLQSHSAAVPSTNHLHPAFCLRYLDRQSKYGFPSEDGRKSTILSHFNKLSQMSWGEIQLTDRKASGHEQIDQKSLNRKPPIPLTPDEKVIAFRLNKQGRMVGCRRHKVFYIFWFDFDFDLYKHN